MLRRGLSPSSSLYDPRARGSPEISSRAPTAKDALEDISQEKASTRRGDPESARYVLTVSKWRKGERANKSRPEAAMPAKQVIRTKVRGVNQKKFI